MEMNVCEVCVHEVCEHVRVCEMHVYEVCVSCVCVKGGKDQPSQPFRIG